MSEVTARNMDMLSVRDVAILISQAGVRYELNMEGLHRNIRQWTDKGMIYSWGRAGTGKTSGRLYDFNQVYRAAFLSVVNGRFDMSDIVSAYNYLVLFDGAGAPTSKGEEPDLAVGDTGGHGVVCKTADGLNCVLAQGAFCRPDSGTQWQTMIGMFDHGGTIAGLISDRFPDADAVNVLNASVIVRSILDLDPRFRAIGDHDIPATTEPPVETVLV